MVTPVYYSSRPPTVAAPPAFGVASANFVAVHGPTASRTMHSNGYHACSLATAGSGRVPVTVSAGRSSPIWTSVGSGQVRERCDALSRSAQVVASNGYTPVQQLRTIPTSKTPQPPHQPSIVHHSSGGATTPVTPLLKARDTLSASQRPYPSTRVVPSQSQRHPGSPSTAGGGRAVSPRVVRPGHFVWPPMQPSSGSPLTPTRVTNRDLAERRGQLSSSTKTAVKVHTSENAPPVQAKNRSPLDATPKQGKAAQSPHPQREVLRERNEQSPSIMACRSPLVTSTERSPAGDALSSKLDADSSTKLPGRQTGRGMAWQDVHQAASASPPNASPPAVAVRPKVQIAPRDAAPEIADACPKRPPSPVQEDVQIVPRDLAPEVSEIVPSLTFSLSNSHPMVTPEEKAFILACLQAFSDIVEREGGFKQYSLKDDCEARDELIAMQEGEDALTPQELLRRSFEATLRNSVRNGHDSVTVLLGGTYSMGMKKVVKVEVKCEETGLSQVMSIYWDWDVKFEQRSGQN